MLDITRRNILKYPGMYTLALAEWLWYLDDSQLFSEEGRTLLLSSEPHGSDLELSWLHATLSSAVNKSKSSQESDTVLINSSPQIADCRFTQDSHKELWNLIRCSKLSSISVALPCGRGALLFIVGHLNHCIELATFGAKTNQGGATALFAYDLVPSGYFGSPFLPFIRLWRLRLRLEQFFSSFPVPCFPKLEKRAAHVQLERHPTNFQKSKSEKSKSILFDFSFFSIFSTFWLFAFSMFRLFDFSSSLSTFWFFSFSFFFLRSVCIRNERTLSSK